MSHYHSFFKLDEIRDTTSSYPVMLPTCHIFAAAMKRLGIRADDTLIVYDTADAGIYCAPRVAFTLAYFGLPHVYILNSFRQYVADGYPLSSPAPFPPPAKPDDDDDATLVPCYYRVADPASIISFQELRDSLFVVLSDRNHRYQILDSRTLDCFAGRGAAVSEGHIQLNSDVCNSLIHHVDGLPIATCLSSYIFPRQTRTYYQL